MTSPQTTATTDPQSIIAALQQRLDTALSEMAALTEELAARTAELLERKSEFGERIDHQAATIDVLKAMSASPGDPQPVFDLIARQATNQCNVPTAAAATFDGTMMHLAAQSGFDAAYVAQFPRPVGLDFSMGRAVLNRRVDQVEDITADPGHSFAPVLGPWSVVAVPILRDGQPLGAITIGRPAMGPFSASQVALLQTFAEQAVIAITSAETYRALQTRTSDLQETLEYQTATSDVLKVISRTTFDLQPVLDTVVETAARLCNADQAVLARSDGRVAWLASNFGFPTEYEAYVRSFGTFPVDEHSPLAAFRALCGRHVVHIHDVAAVPNYPDHPIRLGKQRTSLGVPLLREGEPVGVIVLARQRVKPFTERQIELVSTFADQAVIAIENSRLITEQREALEQQTATAEVLQVINASPGNLMPVFDAMLEKAMRLSGAAYGVLRSYDGEHLHMLASRGVPTEYAEFLARSGGPGTPGDSPMPGTAPMQALETRQPAQRLDVRESIGYTSGIPGTRAIADLGGARTCLHVPLVKDQVTVGLLTFYRQEVRAFSDKQIALLQNFAAQAVIAMENARLITEQREALEQQTATAEVLQVINASPGNLAPVFEAILDKAHTLCGATLGSLFLFDGELFCAAATHGYPEDLAQRLRQGTIPAAKAQLLDDSVPWVHNPDLTLVDGPTARAVSGRGGVRTNLMLPLRKDGKLLGAISCNRREVRPFTDKEIALLQNFAAQAVIAIENARLITEQSEALEQQTATAEVLQVINANPGDLKPVFDTLLKNAMRLCEVAFGGLVTFDGKRFSPVVMRGVSSAYADYRAHNQPSIAPDTVLGRILHGANLLHITDLMMEEAYRNDDPDRRAIVDLGGARTCLAVALRKDEVLLGLIMLYRQEVRPFNDRQVALLQNFAAQAVVAMENARLLNEVRQRQEELRITFENMGDGVAMFDETQHLVAWNRKFQDILDVPDDIIARRRTFSEYVHYLAERGEYGPEADPEGHVRGLIEQAGQSRTYERTRPDGRVIEIRHNPVPGGGFVLIYADITERKRNEAEIRAARDAAEEASRTIEAAYRDLKAAQANLIQAEKMASLGQLTAGIAHEIKNPLNFVNNFAALSTELIDELGDVLAPEPLGETARTEVDDLTTLLKGNLEKVVQHGQRADGIVRSMLDHSRGSSGERRMVDLNALIDEALNLAYHGARAQDQSFNITLERDFCEGIVPIEVNPQDITRVFLNLFANGFYAVTRRARDAADAGFVPTLKVTTHDAGEAVEIRVWDNGTGVPIDIRDKLFQPFFTTKPTGEGTGLGLSITYDIVTQQHGGSIAVDSKVGEYSEFTIQLPRKL